MRTSRRAPFARRKALVLLFTAAAAQHRQNDGRSSAHGFSFSAFVSSSVHVASNTRRLHTRAHNRCKRAQVARLLGASFRKPVGVTSGCGCDGVCVTRLHACTSFTITYMLAFFLFFSS